MHITKKKDIVSMVLQDKALADELAKRLALSAILRGDALAKMRARIQETKAKRHV